MSYVDENGKPLPFYFRNGFKLTGKVGQFVKDNELDMGDFEDENDFVIHCNL